MEISSLAVQHVKLRILTALHYPVEHRLSQAHDRGRFAKKDSKSTVAYSSMQRRSRNHINLTDDSFLPPEQTRREGRDHSGSLPRFSVLYFPFRYFYMQSRLSDDRM